MTAKGYPHRGGESAQDEQRSWAVICATGACLAGGVGGAGREARHGESEPPLGPPLPRPERTAQDGGLSLAVISAGYAEPFMNRRDAACEAAMKSFPVPMSKRQIGGD